MDHEHFQELINLYLDTGLQDTASTEMFAHLGTCEECRKYMHSMMRVRSFYQQEETASASDSLDRRVFASVRSLKDSEAKKYHPISFWSTRILMPLPAAASIAVLIIIGSLLCSPLLFQQPMQEKETAIEMTSKLPPELRQQLQYFEEMNYAGKNIHHH